MIFFVLFDTLGLPLRLEDLGASLHTLLAIWKHICESCRYLAFSGNGRIIKKRGLCHAVAGLVLKRG